MKKDIGAEHVEDIAHREAGALVLFEIEIGKEHALWHQGEVIRVYDTGVMISSVDGAFDSCHDWTGTDASAINYADVTNYMLDRLDDMIKIGLEPGLRTGIMLCSDAAAR